MYTNYWELQAKPFELGCDPRFYYQGEGNQVLLSKLRYAIESRHGSALLRGPVGVGKSMLATMLRAGSKTGELGPFITLTMPQLAADEILCWLATELEQRLTSGSHSFSELIDRYVLQRPQKERVPLLHYALSSLERFLIRNTREKRHAVLVLDDAQQITDSAVYPLLKSLLGITDGGRPVLSVLLLADARPFAETTLAAFADECLETVAELPPFTSSETANYIQFRLKQAGCQKEIFTASALDSIHFLTEGIARKINRLCDLALLVGYAENLTEIDEPVTEALNQELIATV